MAHAPAETSAVPANRRNDLRYHILAIVVLSGVVYYLLDTATDVDVIDISRILDFQAQEYDYFMADVDSIHYTPDGQADYRFTARRLTHFPNPEYTIMEIPRFYIFLEDNSTWQVDSRSGRVEVDLVKNQQRLMLQDDVVVSGTLADGNPVTMYTDALTIYPETKSLQTEADVLIEGPGFTTSSSGLQADLNSNEIRQLSNGQLRYER